MNPYWYTAVLDWQGLEWLLMQSYDYKIKVANSGDNMGLLRGIFWITAAAATGGLVLALLPNDWDGIDGCCDDE